MSVETLHFAYSKLKVKIKNILKPYILLSAGSGSLSVLVKNICTLEQTKRFEELTTTYSVTIDELKDFKKRLLLHPSEKETKEIIYDTEKSISRDNKLWVSKISP